MDVSQYIQILGLFSGIGVLVKMVYEVKLEVTQIKSSLEKNTQITEYKFESVNEKLKELEEKHV